MPLPPALAAKLAKRGILRGTDGPTAELGQDTTDKVQEEIIAEDYDDTPQLPEVIPKAQPETVDKYKGWHGCPNKWNVYHECSQSCRKQWGDAPEINSSYNKSRLKMLQKYPLPSHWVEILEPGLGKYYYWNTDTDMVAWLPPGHPKCQVSRAAATLRKQMLTDRESRLMEEEDSQKKDDGKGSEYEDSSDDEDGLLKIPRSNTADSSASSEQESDTELEVRDKRNRVIPEHRERVRDFEDKNRRGKKRQREDALDPMDPAAYSDCPRGNWSSGLPQKDEAQTGVDTTASGPLFQMRPYPNPGSILRANKNPGPIKP